MRNESGKSIIILIILIILIMIGASVIVNYAKEMMKEKEKQDLRTNMLLIQAEAKKGAEEVCFQTVNLDENKEEDKTRINEIKQEYLSGIVLSTAPSEVQEAIKNIPDVTFDENCYYLDENTMTEMGIKDFDIDDGYFIVKYDFSNTNVEVINTKGCEGHYTLTQMVQMIEETES